MPKIVDRDAMRGRVLDAALDAFADKGFHAATIADVAAAAGMGKGTLYLYFASKDAIAEAMVDRHLDDLRARLDAQTPPTTLAAFVDVLADAMAVTEANARFIRVFFEVFGPSFGDGGFAARVAGFFDDLGDRHARALARLQAAGQVRADADPVAAGRALASMVDGMILHGGLFAIPPGRHAAQRRAAAETFLRGLRPDDG